MEDAATAEISRAQLWQWRKHNAQLEDGRAFDLTLYQELRTEETQVTKSLVGEEVFSTGLFEQAIHILDELVQSDQFEEFLTLPAYQIL
jgi:malate synthase